jgi:TRAP-type transport system periplasmic protein
VIVNRAAFNALPKAEQDAVTRAAAAAEKRGWDAAKKANGDSLDRLKAGGMQILPPSAALKSDMGKVGDTLLKEWLEKSGAEGKALVDAYRK